MPKQTEDEIREVCDGLRDLLIQKNRAYGDSALNPKNIFSKLPAGEAIKIRLDDKLSRIIGGDAKAFDEDPIKDIMGYLVLLTIANKRASQSETKAQEEDVADLRPISNIVEQLSDFRYRCKCLFGEEVSTGYLGGMINPWRITWNTGSVEETVTGKSPIEAIQNMCKIWDAVPKSYPIGAVKSLVS